MKGLSSELMNEVGAMLSESKVVMSSLVLGADSSGKLCLNNGLLRATLTLPEHLEFAACRGKSVHHIFSAWQRMADAGAVPRLKKLVLGDLTFTDGQATIRFVHHEKLPRLGALLTTLAATFKVTTLTLALDHRVLRGRDCQPLTAALALFDSITTEIRGGSSAEIGQLLVAYLSDPAKLAKSSLVSFSNSERLARPTASFKWKGGANPSLSVLGLMADDQGSLVRMLERGSLKPTSLTMNLIHNCRDSLRIFAHPENIVLSYPGMDVLGTFLSLHREVKARALPLWRSVNLRRKDSELSFVRDGRATITQGGTVVIDELASLITTLCHDFGVDDLTLHVNDRNAPATLVSLAESIASLPLRALAVQNTNRLHANGSDWVINVVRPGPGPLQRLSLPRGLSSFEAHMQLAVRLGPNESLVKLSLESGDVLKNVSPINFRLLSGTTLAKRNRAMRRTLASLLSGLALGTASIPSEVGFAIRRAQARQADPLTKEEEDAVEYEEGREDVEDEGGEEEEEVEKEEEEEEEDESEDEDEDEDGDDGNW
jgi:hypothetical protein